MRQTTKSTGRKGAVTQRPTASADRPGEPESGVAMRETPVYCAPKTTVTMGRAGLFTNGETLH